MLIEPLSSALTNLTTSFVNGFPGLVYALLWVIVGYVLGKLLASIVKRVLKEAKIDSYLKEREHMSFKLSSILSTVVKWVVYLVFLQQAATLLGVAVISAVVNEIIAFVPGIVGAVIVLLASYAIAMYVKEDVIGDKELYTSMLGKAIFFLVLYVGVATALPLVSIDTMLINTILLVLIASVGLGLAIAIGWGLKDSVDELAKEQVMKYKSKK
ncbi:MAG: hypothetical protein KAT91_03360 [Candidatus Aenigmarchaeota archaeon]|nr:hypothetical protein [Candidatus Aenigmarchaeota archaeon]